ncbi:MAG: General secretion pathway protein K [Deltaproteobacteria bacterium ADurb.Bin510]|jgi:general secretion pathway protein K|nr:MAG: General secretion pathway protein K [Deltaproteobacteria bacterium ADurb.Bin510]
MRRWLPRLAGDERGMVLLLVLATVALFTAMVVEFGSDQSMDLELAYNYRDSLQAQYLARAGLEGGLKLLKDDDAAYDCLEDDWAKFAEYSLMTAGYLEGMSFSGTISDECAKFDLNSLIKKDGQRDEFRAAQFKRLFKLLEIPASELAVDDLTKAIVDWIDADSDLIGPGGAEDDYYQGLEPAYRAKNAPFDAAEELLLVKGMKSEYFYGTEDYKGLNAYLTAGSGGKLNANTAGEIMLQSLSDKITPQIAKAVVDGRKDKPFKTKAELTEQFRLLGIDTSLKDEAGQTALADVLTVASSWFMADIQGQMQGGAIINLKACIQRMAKEPRVVYYKIY